MTENKTRIEEMAESLGEENDPFDRDAIRAILYSRLAAGLENKEPGANKTGFFDENEAWDAITKYLLSMVEKNPEKAFLFGIDLTLLETSQDIEQEKVNKWIRTSGLTLLGFDLNKSRLDSYLEAGKFKNELTELLTKNINIDAAVFKTEHDFYNPLGCTLIQSIYIGLGLNNARSQNARSIFTLAENRKTDPGVITATSIFTAIPGCDYVRERI